MDIREVKDADTSAAKANRAESRRCECAVAVGDRRTHTRPLRYAPRQPTMTNLDSRGNR